MASVVSDFQVAVDTFRRTAKLDEAELADFEMTDLHALRQAINSIQNKQAQNRKLMYMKRLDPFLRTMESYGKVLETLNVSTVIAFIWGPMKYLLLIASTFSEALNSLLDAYQQIGEQFPQFLQYEQLFVTSPQMRTVLAMIYQDILEFHREALRYFRQPMWKKLFSATWRGFNSQIDSLTNKMRQHRRLIESQATIVEFEEVVKLRKLADAEFRHIRESDLDRRRSKVLQWLSPASAERTQEECEKAREEYPGTGLWLLENARFKGWFDPIFCSNPLLWLSGIPGAGKTILASLVVEEAKKRPNSQVAFFYCKYGDAARNNFISIARSLIAQILSKETTTDSLLLYIDEKASGSGETVLASLKLAKELLEILLKSRETTYLIIDGLDECNRDERKELSTWFCQLVDELPRESRDSIRCLFVSQDDGYARKDLAMIPSINLTAKDNRTDIEIYTSIWYERIQLKFGALDSRTCHVSNLITARAQGMFLFAKLVMLNLFEQTSREKMLEELEPDKIPQKLDEAYQRILDRILDSNSKARPNTALKLLGWLVCAKRPFKWYEIQGAESIDIVNQSVNFEQRMHRVNPKDLCASLVELRSDDSVELVHSTAREYLIRSKYINVAKFEYDLAVLIVSYLNFPEVERDRPVQETEQALLRGYFSFYEYAVSAWVFHLEAGIQFETTDTGLEQLVESLEVFLDLHWASPATPVIVSKTVEEKLKPLRGYDFYSSLSQAIASTRKRFGRHGQGISENEVLDLHIITAQIRAALETAACDNLDPQKKALLQKFYGSNWFKCPRMNCQYFYQGFQNEESRRQHVGRHERAFLCYFEGCPTTTFGCATSKELEAHLSNYHGIATSDSVEFPTLPKSSRKHPSTFQCTLCPKNFTRSYNLRNHLRTHAGEKPFACAVCSLAFTRINDKNRHEASHSTTKSFVCKGPLAAGGEWGCGLQFQRADKLGAHHQSAVGSRCLKPLLDERNAAKRQLEEDLMRKIEEETAEKQKLEDETVRKFEEQLSQLGQTVSPREQEDGILNLGNRLPSGSVESQIQFPVQKSKYERPKHERVYCQQCDNCPYGFRGANELRRHAEKEHNKTLRRWIIVEPAASEDCLKPLLPLSRCKACIQKKKYGTDYNAAAHLRRVHFKREKGAERRGFQMTMDLPSMSELKSWMKETKEPGLDYELEQSQEADTPGSEPQIGTNPHGMSTMQSFGLEFEESLDSPLNFRDFQPDGAHFEFSNFDTPLGVEIFSSDFTEPWSVEDGVFPEPDNAGPGNRGVM